MLALSLIRAAAHSEMPWPDELDAAISDWTNSICAEPPDSASPSYRAKQPSTPVLQPCVHAAASASSAASASVSSSSPPPTASPVVSAAASASLTRASSARPARRTRRRPTSSSSVGLLSDALVAALETGAFHVDEMPR